MRWKLKNNCPWEPYESVKAAAVMGTCEHQCALRVVVKIVTIAHFIPGRAHHFQLRWVTFCCWVCYTLQEILRSLTQQPLHNPAEGPFKSPLKRYRSPKWQGFESPTPEVLVNGSEERSHDALAPPPGSQLTACLGSVDAFIPDVEESGTIMWVIMP